MNKEVLPYESPRPKSRSLPCWSDRTILYGLREARARTHITEAVPEVPRADGDRFPLGLSGDQRAVPAGLDGGRAGTPLGGPVKSRGGTKFNVRTYRCSACGFLESFATEPFK